MTRIALVALLLAAPGPVEAKAKSVKLALAHCEGALVNARLYEAAPPMDERAIAMCEGWYMSNASEAELEALVCMAEAEDRVAWDACRAPFIPSPSSSQVSVQLEVALVEWQVSEGAGVLGALRSGSELDGMFGASKLEEGLEGTVGGLIGAKGTQIGSGGLGSRGSGLGGGGTAEGLGGLGTRGTGGGASGYGSGGGNFGTTGAGAGVSAGGDPIILGALERSVIDAVVKRHMAQIRYCYQRELTSDPNISGKIVVKFVVSKDGSVASAATKSSTMGNAAVEACVNSRFLRMQFPQPKGGGIVIVSYPFLFRPG